MISLSITAGLLRVDFTRGPVVPEDDVSPNGQPVHENEHDAPEHQPLTAAGDRGVVEAGPAKAVETPARCVGATTEQPLTDRHHA